MDLPDERRCPSPAPGCARGRRAGLCVALVLSAIGPHALAAPAPIEYALETPAPAASVQGPGRLIRGFRVNPGGSLRFATVGDGALKLLYFQEFTKAMPLPDEVRLLVAIDGVGKMFPLKPKPAAEYAFPEKKAPTQPSAPMGVILRLPAGEHILVVKLAPGPKLGGVLSLPDARERGAAGALAELDLDLPPIDPLGDELTLDLDLGAPGAAPIADLGFDLDLDLPPAPAPTKPPEPAKPVAAAPPPAAPPPAKPVAAAPKPPEKPSPKRPSESVAPLPTPGLVATVEPAKPAPRKPEVAAKAPVVDPGPPPELGVVEFGVKAGWALSRGRLAGQGVYLGELGYRLKAQGLPSLRLSLTSGYTLLAGQWSTFTPGFGYGSVLQNSHLVPVELGAGWSFGPFGPLVPYLGAALALSFAAVEVSAYSLPSRRSSGLAPGVTGVAGLRFEWAPFVFVAEVRHQEGALPDRQLARVGEQRLPTTSFLGGAFVAF